MARRSYCATRAQNRMVRAEDLPPAARERLGINIEPRHKYGAVRQEADGHTFDSTREYERYVELKLLQRAKKIHELKVHPSWEIIINGVLVCVVELDFRYKMHVRDGVFGPLVIVAEDVKGVDNPLSKLKRKLLKAVHNIDVVLVK